MIMTHYMELLSLHQPWNLIIFMLIPMVLAETILAASIFTLFYKDKRSKTWQTISRLVTIILGVFFIGVVIYLGVAYIPTIQWRGLIDYIAVWSYVLAIIPAIFLLVQALGFFDTASAEKRMLHHVILMILFVAFTHLAMVFGMADPQLAGYMPQNTMPMNHSMDHSKMNHEMMNMK